MKQAIWKFSIDEPDTVKTFEMPLEAKILSAQCQHNSVSIWALVNPVRITEPRTFRLIMTGHKHDFSNLQFTNTIQTYEGDMVLHLFEQLKE